jgi:hypothetical protein
MRADLTFMALAYEPNRYLLTRLIAKVTRKLHRPNTRVQDTMNDAFKWFGCSQPGAAPVSWRHSAVQKSLLHYDAALNQIQSSPLKTLGVST